MTSAALPELRLADPSAAFSTNVTDPSRVERDCWVTLSRIFLVSTRSHATICVSDTRSRSSLIVTTRSDAIVPSWCTVSAPSDSSSTGNTSESTVSNRSCNEGISVVPFRAEETGCDVPASERQLAARRSKIARRRAKRQVPRRAHAGYPSRRPETSMPQRVLFAGRPQVAAVVIGPESVLEDVLRVGRLPQHEITGPLLPGSPQQQIHVGNVGAMQVPGDGRLGDPFGVQLARRGLARDIPCGFGNFGATPVVDAVIHRDHIVVQSHLLGDRQLVDDAAPQSWTRAHPTDLHTHLVEAHPTASHHVAVEAHQETDFVGGPLPILGGKRVQAKPLDANFYCAADDVDDDRLAHLVALDAGQPALGGPAAVAVHHDGDVIRQLLGRDPRCGRLGDVLRRSAGPAVG